MDGATVRHKVHLKRDSTRGRLAGALNGLFQLKLDGDPKVKVQIVELIKSSDNNDERDHLRVGDVVLGVSSGDERGGPHLVSDQRSPFESIGAVRQHIKGLGSELTLHVARHQQGASSSAHGAGLGSRAALSRLTQTEQLQVGVVETVGKLGLAFGLGRLRRDWYDRLELQVVELRLTPPQDSIGLRMKLGSANALSLADELGGAGRLSVRAELERTGVVHEFGPVPWDGKAGTLSFAMYPRALLPIHPLGDSLRLSAHCRSAASFLLRRELGHKAVAARAREMGEKEPMKNNVVLALSGDAGEEVGRLVLCVEARYVTRSRIGERNAATRVAALVRGHLDRRFARRKLAYVEYVQCLWKARNALRMMKQLRRENCASTGIQQWLLRGKRNRKKLLTHNMLELDPFEVGLLQLPIKVLHASDWQPTSLEQLASSAARTALPASLLPAALDDAHLVLHGKNCLRYGRLLRPQPLLVRAPLAARRTASAALRHGAELGTSAAAQLCGRWGRAVSASPADADDGSPPPDLGRWTSSRGSSIDEGLFDGGGLLPSARASQSQPSVPYKLLLYEPRAETRGKSSWLGSTHEAAAAEPIKLAEIDRVHVHDYQTNEWHMSVRRKGQADPTLLHLQARSAAALNAWMHVFQPVLRLDEMDETSSDATRAGDVQQYFLSQFTKYHTDKDAALEVARGRLLPGRSHSPSKAAGAARKQRASREAQPARLQ